MYFPRLIDNYLIEWAERTMHKPLLLRGARQVGKSTAVHHLAERFKCFVEINFEKQPVYKSLFKSDLDVNRIVSQIAVISGQEICPGNTLLFIDEVQECPEAIMSLRFFKEDMPHLHVIAAGSLLEFALEGLPTFGVGRIHSMFMYPMTFDEFLIANGEKMLLEARNSATNSEPLSIPIYEKLVELIRTYMLVGGMPEVVGKWVETHSYLECQELQDDIIVSYEDDFPKYRKKADPTLLQQTLRSTAVQATKKFVYSKVEGNYSISEVKKALEMLTMAGLVIPVTSTSANGLPLGGEADTSYRKFMILDTGLMLRLLNMYVGDITDLTTHILTSNVADLVNKGSMAEMMAGLEMLHYKTPNIRHSLYYWLCKSKNSQAEIDYVTSYNMSVLPVEVKAGTQGGMKSLWAFMREKKLSMAVRCSMENIGKFEYVDGSSDNAVRSVQICPLFAMSRMEQLIYGLHFPKGVEPD